MMMHWLTHLAGESLGNFEATDTLDRELSRRALLARTDHEQRDLLFTQLAAKIERFAARYRGWRIDPWEYDDVLQLTYFVYLDTVERWKPRDEDGEPAGYLYYFLAVYPLWLSTAVRRLIDRRQISDPSVGVTDEHGELADDTPAADDSVIIDDFCRRLGRQEATLLKLRVLGGRSIPQAAREIGIARRTAYRRWDNIVAIGREYLREVG